MNMKGVLLILLLMAAISSCKGQLPKYVANPLPKSGEITVEWYNNLVVNPKFDTVMVFKTPSFSTIRYVIVRPLYSNEVARVESSTGHFLYFLTGERFYYSGVGYDGNGNVIRGLEDVQISGCKLVVQYEMCEKCKFKPSKGGT